MVWEVHTSGKYRKSHILPVAPEACHIAGHGQDGGQERISWSDSHALDDFILEGSQEFKVLQQEVRQPPEPVLAEKHIRSTF